MLRSIARKLLHRSPKPYEFLRSSEILFNSYLRRIHDPEFQSLTQFISARHIADIGANVGQSLVTLTRLFPGARITAFEANPACYGLLEKVRRVLGTHISIEHCGLGDETGELPFFVPVLKNGVMLLQEGSFEAEAMKEERTFERIGTEFGVRKCTLPVRTLDSFGRNFDLLKIDVQGFEYQVLRGARELLLKQRPVLFIEHSEKDELVESFLWSVAYEECTPAALKVNRIFRSRNGLPQCAP